MCIHCTKHKSPVCRLATLEIETIGIESEYWAFLNKDWNIFPLKVYFNFCNYIFSFLRNNYYYTFILTASMAKRSSIDKFNVPIARILRSILDMVIIVNKLPVINYCLGVLGSASEIRILLCILPIIQVKLTLGIYEYNVYIWMTIIVNKLLPFFRFVL